jgi:hypothetical protein
MWMSAGWRAGEDQVKLTRRYQIMKNLVGNRSRVRRLSQADEAMGEFLIRTDLLPLNARTQGTTFSMNGTPLEIDLVENSVEPQD